MLDVKVKLCGFKDKETIDFACSFNINFLGFVFYDKSPRNVNIKEISDNVKSIPKNIKKVAVVVGADDNLLAEIKQNLEPQFVQLHGGETVDRAKEIREKFGFRIIKAFRVEDASDLETISEFEEVADYFLFDAKVDGAMGGSGKTFDWSILRNLKTEKEWFLSGGITSDNVKEAIKKTNAKMIDVSSDLEEVRGVKSKKSIEGFIDSLVFS